MELTCSRCHRTVQTEDCFCPVCGLPQIVFDQSDSPAAGQTENSEAPARDASSIDWKTALRYCLMLAVPAGILCSLLAHLGILLMGVIGFCAVVLYVRSQRPAWITTGAGARIGLVTGIIGGWTAAAAMALTLFSMRYWLHQGQAFDDLMTKQINEASQIQMAISFGVDAQMAATERAFLLSPEGRATETLMGISFLALLLLLFSVIGGALSARMLAHTRRPEV
jgi:RNA polymerase subunit RPABC4/transcription elongation factor Spt4